MLRFLVLLVLAVSTPALADVCGDMNGDGSVSVTDGVMVLRMAADLPTQTQCGSPQPVPTATPVPQPTIQATPVVVSPVAFLLGTWNFHFTIISSFTDTYRFQQLTTTNTGKPAITGLNQYGGLVVGARIQDLSPGSSLPYTYSVLDNQLGIICDFHLFDRINDNAVEGDTFLMATDASGACDPDTLSGNAHAMTGQKISVSAHQAGAEVLGTALDAAVGARADAVTAEGRALGNASPASSDLDAIRAEVRAVLRGMP